MTALKRIVDWFVDQSIGRGAVVAFVAILGIAGAVMFWPRTPKTVSVAAAPVLPDRAPGVDPVIMARGGNAGFGRKRSEPARKRSELELLRDLVESEGLDWYFAHHGCEGNWRKPLSIMEAEGRGTAARLFAEAGYLHEKEEGARWAAWEANEQMPPAVRLSENDFWKEFEASSGERTRTYLERMHQLSRELIGELAGV